MIDDSQALGDLELSVGEKDGQEALQDHVIELRGGVIELHHAASRNDGKVIADLSVVKNPLLELEAVVVDRVLGPLGQATVRLREIAYDLLYVTEVILWQVARIGPRVGDHFVTLIERLRQAQGVFGSKRRLSLQSCEVVKLGRDLLGRLFVLRDDAGLALASVGDDLGALLVPEALGAAMWIVGILFEIGIDELARVGSGSDLEGAVDFGVRGWGESLDFFFPLC